MTRLLPTLLLSCWLCAGALADVHPAVLAAQEQRINVITAISNSTVAVFGAGSVGGGGSAVVITPDGYALTNFHVTKPVGNHIKCGMNDGNFYDAVIVGVDPTGDVALIKLTGREDFPAATLGNSDDVEAGDWCIVSGNPFLLATDFHPTVTYGIVSGVHRYQYPAGTLLEYADCIQTDAAINPGNSGGPLWDAEGRLIGINGRGSFEKRGRVNVGVGYAISINQIKNFLGYLRSGRIVDHATLGATVSTDEDGKVVVTNILHSSDAYRRGLRYGDEIVSFGGRSIESTNSFKNALGIFPKGWRVPLSFTRDGERRDVLVRLAGVHRSEELIAKLKLGGIAPPDQEPGDRDQPPKREGEPEQPAPNKADPTRPTMAPEIAKLFQERSGYANYYFNLQERDRVWDRFKQLSDFSQATGRWWLQGRWNENMFSCVLGEENASARVAGLFIDIDFSRELSEQLEPRKSGGLLLALHQWRRMLVLGPQNFGDVYYLGTTPVPNHDALADALVATYDVLESRYYHEQATGKLIGMELYPDLDVDPCELYFRGYHSVDGRQVPTIIEVVFGDERHTLELDLVKTDVSSDVSP